MEKRLEIRYEEYEREEMLNEAERELMAAAREARKSSYSPYSHFKVGAAVRLKNGEIEKGSNQENLAYPSGLCAERVSLFGASARWGAECEVEALAITAEDSEGKEAEASPCGACRQVMLEQEMRQGNAIKVMVRLENGSVRVYKSVKSLLPFAFSAEL